METMTVKEQITNALIDLPDTDTIEEAMERLYVLYKLQEGIEAVERGDVVTHEEAKKRLSAWLV